MTPSFRSYRSPWWWLLLLSSACGVLAQPKTSGHVTLSVSTTAETPVDGAYVTAYRETDRWDEPRVETTTDAAGTAKLKLEDGPNIVVIAADGFAPKTILLEGGAKRPGTANVSIDRLVPLRGSVSDTNGHAIAGARVSVLEPEYSPRARRHLGARETMTGGDGAWILPLARQANTVIVEADGYATTVVSDGGGKKLDAVLEAAVPVRLELDRVDPDLTVTLRQAGPGSMGDTAQDRAWSKAVTAKTLEWSRVPPGTFHVLLRHRDPLRFVHDERLLTIRLTAGQPFTATVVLPRIPQAATSAAKVFARRNEAAEPAPYRLTAGRLEEIDFSAVGVVGGLVFHLNTAHARELVIPTRTHILLPKPVEGATAGSIAYADAFPRADATLRVRSAEPSMPVPSEGVAELQRCGRTARATVGFRVDKSGAAGFAAPADCARMIFRWPPFEPVIVDQALPAGRQTALGDLELAVSASVEVRVMRQRTDEALQGAAVRVLLSEQEQVALAEAVTSEAGVALVEGLPVRRRLYVEARDPKTALTGSAAVDLEAGERRRIDPLSVQEPARVIVKPRISAGLRERYPGAAVSSIQLSRVDADAPGTTFKQPPGPLKLPVTNIATATFEDVPPGRWTVVATVFGTEQGQTVELDEIDLAAGEELTIEPEVDSPVFRGRVTWHGRGMKGTLHIGTDPTAPRRRTAFGIAEDGTFTAVLSKTGVFAVEVSQFGFAGEPIWVGQVPFTDPARPIEIALELGRLVVRARGGGRPAAPARVTLTARVPGPAGIDLKTITKMTDSAGEAKFEFLRPGSWLVEARVERDGLYAQKQATIAADGAAVLELDLQRPEEVTGVARESDGRRIAGARIACAFVGALGLPEWSTATTRADGTFSLRVQPATGVASCSLVTPRRMASGFQVRGGERALQLSVPANTGGVTIDRWWTGYNDWIWLVGPHGAAIALTDVARATSQVGGRLHVAGLAAGTWSIVHVRTIEELMQLVSGRGRTLTAVETLTITPGATAVVDLDTTANRQLTRVN